jgi:serine/threonine protein kinase
MAGARRSLGSFINPEEIGSGAYGIVFRAFDQDTGRYIAMKKVRLNPDSSGAPATLLREISLLKKLRSEHVIELIDVVLSPPSWCFLIFEYADTDLRKMLNAGPVTTSFIRSTMKQLLQGLEHCHSRRVMHRDLKPENILLSANAVKIADFGLARIFQVPLQPLSGEVQTLHYRAPEILLGYLEYSLAVDMWSAGCIFAEMLLGRRLFQGTNELHQILEIARILGPPPAELCSRVQRSSFLSGLQAFQQISLGDILHGAEPEALDLLSKMLDYDPCSRISATAALEHAYFAN